MPPPPGFFPDKTRGRPATNAVSRGANQECPSCSAAANGVAELPTASPDRHRGAPFPDGAFDFVDGDAVVGRFADGGAHLLKNGDQVGVFWLASIRFPCHDHDWSPWGETLQLLLHV